MRLQRLYGRMALLSQSPNPSHLSTHAAEPLSVEHELPPTDCEGRHAGHFAIRSAALWMVIVIQIATVLIVALVVFAAPPAHRQWHAFMTKFARTYATDAEHDSRYDVFRRNLAYIDAHNAEADLGLKTHRLAVNQFADLTHDEFSARLKLRPSRASSPHRLLGVAASNDTLPDSVDWRIKGMVTHVKDQGQCGSCWSFAATGSMEGAQALAASSSEPTRRFGNRHLMEFSEQELVDCVDNGQDTCDTGGSFQHAFEFAITNGTVLESDYVYVSGADMAPERCRIDKYRPLHFFSKYVVLPPQDELALKAASAQHPGIAVAIDASSQDFQFYNSGVYRSDECSSELVDHAVLVVGYDTDKDGGDYWLVKNSWGVTWGDLGYIKMARNAGDMCGIASQPAYIVAAPVIDSVVHTSVM